MVYFQKQDEVFLVDDTHKFMRWSSLSVIYMIKQKCTSAHTHIKYNKPDSNYFRNAKTIYPALFNESHK